MKGPGTSRAERETIASISTPLGTGGIGIVRMSGSRAVEIAQRVFSAALARTPASDQGYSMRYGHLRDPANGETIDEVLLTVMRAPRTYTREDVVEINCHSGPVVLGRILMILLAMGARLAEPGEFTKRAFLNGRIDLTQAEAVMSVVSAKTEAALRAAVRQLGGELSARVLGLRSQVLHLLSEIEASIDFVDEDLDLIKPAEIERSLKELIEATRQLIESAETGKLLAEGVSAAIVGKANVGKSSLLNALLAEDRAIVTPFPGTTRDVIEAAVNLDGIPLTILDTAGIRDSEDPVEKEGIKRTRQTIESADLVIMVADLSDGPDEGDFQIARLLEERDKRSVLVLNKSDLVSIDEISGGFMCISDITCSFTTIIASIVNREGIGKIRSEIRRLVLESSAGGIESAVLANVRHLDALVATRESLERTLESVGKRLSEEFLSLDLRGALAALGQITGETTTEDLLDEIFRCFCVGK